MPTSTKTLSVDVILKPYGGSKSGDCDRCSDALWLVKLSAVIA